LERGVSWGAVRAQQSQPRTRLHGQQPSHVQQRLNAGIGPHGPQVADRQTEIGVGCSEISPAHLGFSPVHKGQGQKHQPFGLDPTRRAPAGKAGYAPVQGSRVPQELVETQVTPAPHVACEVALLGLTESGVISPLSKQEGLPRVLQLQRVPPQDAVEIIAERNRVCEGKALEGGKGFIVQASCGLIQEGSEGGRSGPSLQRANDRA
jgi:hypothetical protein